MSGLALVWLLWAVAAYQGGARFPDPQLEQVIREKVGRWEGPIERTELLQITHLNAAGRNIGRLDGLENLPRLAVLNLADNRIQDLTPLARLRHLAELDLSGNRLLNLHPLAGLPRLRELDLRDNRIADISPLESVTSLRVLNMRGNRLTDISPLAHLTELVHLNLHSNREIHSIKPLAELRQLQVLVLRDVPVGEEIRVLEGLTALRRLNARRCGIADVTSLAALMAGGGLQDDPARDRLAEIDLLDNPIARDDRQAWEMIGTYWTNIHRRRPFHLFEFSADEETVPHGVVLNEIMASNESTLADEDGDYPDWIELHNTGSTSVALGGWGLADDRYDLFMWTFPDVVMAPGEFLLVFASGKDRRDVSGALHTNFRIRRSGTPLVLTMPEGGVADRLDPTPIPRDISYGRQPDGGEDWYYFDRATPGSPNVTKGLATILPPPEFSHEGGFFTQSFDLTLTHPDPDATVVYTLDGSEPDLRQREGVEYSYKESYPVVQHGEQPGRVRVTEAPDDVLARRLLQSHVYERPLRVTDRLNDPHALAAIRTHLSAASGYPRGSIPKATVVRARAFKDGTLPGATVTHTFMVSRESDAAPGLPALFLTVNESDLFDYECGIYVPGAVADRWLGDHVGRATLFWYIDGNYRNRGRAWERPAHLEVFGPDGASLLRQELGVRVHGYSSRAYPLKSLRFHPRRSYSEEETVPSSLFTDLTNSGHASSLLPAYRRLILRNSGQDRQESLYRDAFMQALVRHLPLETQAVQPAIHFINGEYWGLINIRERLDAFTLAARHGIRPEDLTILSGRTADVRSGREEERDRFLEVVAYAEENDMSLVGHYNWIRRHVDVENLALYYAVQIYFNNLDWPQGNIFWWREHVDAMTGAPDAERDGRWRWLLNDTDFGYGYRGDHTDNSLARVMELTDDAYRVSRVAHSRANRLFRALVLNNADFRHAFINAMADQLNTSFHPRRVRDVLDAFEARIGPYRDEHNNRWNLDTGPQASMFVFAAERPAIQRRHISEVFGVDPVEIRLDVSDASHGRIRVNAIEVVEATPGVGASPYPWDAVYFSGVPIELEALPAEGYRFTGWRLRRGAAGPGAEYDFVNPVLTVLPAEGLACMAVFEPVSP